MKKIAFALLFLLASAAGAEENPKKYAWDEDMPRFRGWEYALTGTALAGAAANFYLVPPPQNALWKGQILFDRRARNAILLPAGAREPVQVATDLLTAPLMAYALLGGPVTAFWVGNKDTAMQLGLINAETMAVVEVLNLTVSNFLPRERPPGSVCGPETKYDPHCVKSFWSGHAANVFAAASLICAEHRAMALYGGGKADKAACVAGFAAATVVGASRIATNNHHASDVVVGAAVGAAIGYLMPNYLHFKFKKAGPKLAYLIPSVSPGGGGLTYVMTW